MSENGDSVTVKSMLLEIIHGENLIFDLSTPELLSKIPTVKQKAGTQYRFEITLKVEDGASESKIEITNSKIFKGNPIETTIAGVYEYSPRSGEEVTVFFAPDVLDDGVLVRAAGVSHQFELSVDSEIKAKWQLRFNITKT